MSLLLPWLTDARAAAPCTAWAPAEVARWGARASAAIDAEDVAGHAAVWRELESALPCLSGPIPRDDWAELLAGLALVENATGGAWREPLSTALSLSPSLRSGLPEPLASFAVAEGAPPGEAVDGWWVDGVAVTAAPDLRGGLHLVQRPVAGGWETVLVRSGAWPDGWLAPAEAPPSPPPVAAPERRRAAVTVGAGVGSAAQRPDRADDHVPEESVRAASLLVGTHGVWTRTAGAFWDLEAPIAVPGPVNADAAGGLALGLGPVELLAGAALSTAHLDVVDAPQTLLLALPHAGVAWRRAIGPGAVDLQAGGGWTPAAGGALLRAGYQGRGPRSAWAGLQGAVHTAAAVEQGGGLRLATTRWSAALEVGLAFAGGGR